MWVLVPVYIFKPFLSIIFFVKGLSVALVRIGLVRQQVVLKDPSSEIPQQGHRKTDPTVFPDAVGIFVQIPLQVCHGPGGQLAGGRPFDDVGKIVRPDDCEGEVDIFFFADHHGLQLRFAPGGCVAYGKREVFDADSEELVYVELFYDRPLRVDLFAVKAARGQGQAKGCFGSAHR